MFGHFATLCMEGLMIIRNIKFKKTGNMFQSKLQEDIKTVKQSKNVFNSADKSTNIYVMEKDNYNRFLRENITKMYKRIDRRKVASINY